MSETRNQYPSISNATRRHCLPFLLASLSALALLGALSIYFAKRQIVIDTSPSVAPGLYVRSAAAPAVGQLVEFRIPASVRSYIRSRTGHDGQEWYILKPIVAGPGDRVDTTQGELRINSRFVAPMPPMRDGFGNLLPRWTENRILGREEFFVFSGRIPNSFDSRCYGPVKRDEIESVRRALITW